MSERITHPDTGKTLTVAVFHIEPKALLQWSADHQITSAKQISWHLLSEAKSLAKLEREMDGDAHHNNYALRVFENALDWSLGLAWLRILAMFREHRPGKCPKPFDLLATKSGAILVRWASGTIKELMPASP